MATFSNLGIKLIQTGEESGTWGTSTNTNFDIVDQAIGGYVSHTMSDSNLTFSISDGATSDARNKIVNFTGTLTANRTITFSPSDLEKNWYVKNCLYRCKWNSFNWCYERCRQYNCHSTYIRK